MNPTRRPPNRRATVSGDLLRFVLQYAAHAGVDARAALAACGLDADRVGGADRVGAHTFGRLLEALAGASRDPCFGLRLGAWADRFPASHLVLATVFNSRTVGDALARLLRFHAILSDAFAPTIVLRGDAAVVRLGRGQARAGRHEADAVIATIVTLLRRLSKQARVLEASFRHSPPADAAEYQRVLGAPIRFDAEKDAVSIPAATLGAPVLFSNPALLRVLERHALGRLADVQDASWTGRVRRSIEAELLESCAVPTLGEIARVLAVSPRTLQLRVNEEGTIFRSIVDGARRSVAEERLQDPAITLSEIAYLAGFADQSAFTHAFRRWTGLTPRAFREARRRRRAASARSGGSGRAVAAAARARRGPGPR
jgi:AraC-like DNA-binding protein